MAASTKAQQAYDLFLQYYGIVDKNKKTMLWGDGSSTVNIAIGNTVYNSVTFDAKGNINLSVMDPTTGKPVVSSSTGKAITFMADPQTIVWTNVSQANPITPPPPGGSSNMLSLLQGGASTAMSVAGLAKKPPTAPTGVGASPAQSGQLPSPPPGAPGTGPNLYTLASAGPTGTPKNIWEALYGPANKGGTGIPGLGVATTGSSTANGQVPGAGASGLPPNGYVSVTLPNGQAGLEWVGDPSAVGAKTIVLPQGFTVGKAADGSMIIDYQGSDGAHFQWNLDASQQLPSNVNLNNWVQPITNNQTGQSGYRLFNGDLSSSGSPDPVTVYSKSALVDGESGTAWGNPISFTPTLSNPLDLSNLPLSTRPISYFDPKLPDWPLIPLKDKLGNNYYGIANPNDYIPNADSLAKQFYAGDGGGYDYTYNSLLRPGYTPTPHDVYNALGNNLGEAIARQPIAQGDLNNVYANDEYTYGYNYQGKSEFDYSQQAAQLGANKIIADYAAAAEKAMDAKFDLQYRQYGTTLTHEYEQMGGELAGAAGAGYGLFESVFSMAANGVSAKGVFGGIGSLVGMGVALHMLGGLLVKPLIGPDSLLKGEGLAMNLADKLNSLPILSNLHLGSVLKGLTSVPGMIGIMVAVTVLGAVLGKKSTEEQGAEALVNEVIPTIWNAGGVMMLTALPSLFLGLTMGPSAPTIQISPPLLQSDITTALSAATGGQTIPTDGSRYSTVFVSNGSATGGQSTEVIYLSYAGTDSKGNPLESVKAVTLGKNMVFTNPGSNAYVNFMDPTTNMPNPNLMAAFQAQNNLPTACAGLSPMDCEKAMGLAGGASKNATPGNTN